VEPGEQALKKSRFCKCSDPQYGPGPRTTKPDDGGFPPASTAPVGTDAVAPAAAPPAGVPAADPLDDAAPLDAEPPDTVDPPDTPGLAGGDRRRRCSAGHRVVRHPEDGIPRSSPEQSARDNPSRANFVQGIV
jgi:hypothetical protein